ncbi:MAG: GT2 family glycosyltransferase [Bacteroidia bacterium]|jgi:GT2 family glycosyltransferase
MSSLRTISLAVTISPPLPINLSVAIVLYESPLDALESTLNSLLRAVSAARECGCLDQVTVFLVDNHSTERYRAAARLMAQGVSGNVGVCVSFIASPDNKGFGSGHNSVMAQLDSDLHLILNPDVELAADALIVGVPALVQRDDAALLCPSATGTSGEPAYLCKRYPSVWLLLLRGFAPAIVQRRFARSLDRYEYREVCALGEPSAVEIASGCFMLVKTASLRAVAGFDEDYFLYFEDFDLSLRLREQGLGSLLFWPDMRIVHHGGHAARKGLLHLQYFLVSGWRFFRRHGWRRV